MKLLNLFLHHPEEQFYVREMTRRIDTQINAVRREIQNLVTLGLLTEGSETGATKGDRRSRSRRKYFTVNKQFPLFQEIRSLLMKANVFLEQQLDREILKLGEIRYLVLLGVFLGLRNQPVDLFIVGTLNEGALRRLMEHTGKQMEVEINYSVLSPQEFKYRKEIADRFVTSVLLAPKTIVVDRLDEKDHPR